MATITGLHNISAALEIIAEELKTMNDVHGNPQYCRHKYKKEEHAVGQFIKWVTESYTVQNYGNENVGVGHQAAALVLLPSGEIDVWGYSEFTFTKEPNE